MLQKSSNVLAGFIAGVCVCMAFVGTGLGCTSWLVLVNGIGGLTLLTLAIYRVTLRI